MNLPMRQHKKRNQALDAFASLAKTWSEWRLGERASQTVAKGTKKASKNAAKARKNAAKAAKNTDASSVRKAMKGTPLKVAGAVALVGGVGAAVAKKLKGGGGTEPLYTPPAPPAPMPAALDMTNVPAAPDMTNVPPAPPTPVVVGDLGSSDEGSAPEAEAETDEAAAPGDKPAGEPAFAASEAASAAASEPAEDDLTEPTVPDTNPGGDDDADAAADPDTVADDDPETSAGKD